MAEPADNVFLKSVEGLLADKEALAAREKELIEHLDAALSKMGYRVVPAGAVAQRRAPPAEGAGRKRGRPAGSGKAAKGEQAS